MINIRHSTYAPNSSSVHTIALLPENNDRKDLYRVAGTDWFPVYLENDTMIVQYCDDRYGRQSGCLHDPEEKIQYLVLAFLTQANKIYEEECNAYIEDVMSGNVKDADFLQFITELQSITINYQNNTFKYLKVDFYNNTYYIDHQSIGVIIEQLKNNGIDYSDFILNDHYCIVTYADG